MNNLTLLKLPMAAIFLYHGFSKKLDKFANAFNLHKVIAGLVIFAEIAAGSGYLLSILDNRRVLKFTITQWASIAVIPIMLYAIFIVHWKNGFNAMNNGYEFQLLILMVAIYLLRSDALPKLL